MGRYVVGIIAVVVLQVAFSIYMSYNASDEPAVAATDMPMDNLKTGPTKRIVPAKTGLPFAVEKRVEIETVKAANTDDVVPVESRGYTKPSTQRAEFTAVRSTATAAPRRAVFRLRTPADRASVERQYFGRMVVERTFWPAKPRTNRSTAVANRQTFGRMVVERTSGV
jgi:hypothetical protein